MLEFTDRDIEMAIKDRRRADEQLVLLQQIVDEHIKEYKVRCKNEDERWNHVISLQEANTTAITELSESTRDLVAVWKAADGTMKTASAIGKFVKWLGGFAVVGVAIKWVFEHLKW